MLRTTHRKPGWIFYPGWIAFTSISMLIAWAIAWAIIAQIVRVVGATMLVSGQRHITEDFLGLPVLVPVLGLLTGLLQYLLLRGYLPRMSWWIAATLLGWLLLFAVGLLSARFSVTMPPALAVALVAGLVGLPQWLLLRRRVSHAGYWMLSSVLGWGVALLLVNGPISSQQDVLAVALLPPIAGSMAWWLLLDKLPHRARVEVL